MCKIISEKFQKPDVLYRTVKMNSSSDFVSNVCVSVCIIDSDTAIMCRSFFIYFLFLSCVHHKSYGLVKNACGFY